MTIPHFVTALQGVLRTGWLTRSTLAAVLLTVGTARAGGITTFQTPTTKQSTTEAKTPPRVDVYGDPLPDGVLVRMGTGRLRHPHAIRLHFAADGKTLISIGQDQTIRFWDLKSGKLQRLQRLPRAQLVMALSADGTTVALTSAEHLHLWDIASAKEIQRIETGNLSNEKRLLWVEFSPDGKFLAAGNADSTVLLWTKANGKELGRYKHKDSRVHNLAFSPDGKILAAAGEQHVLLCDVAAGKELGTIEAGHGPDAKVSFSPDGKLLADAMFSSVVLWEVATRKEFATLAFFDADKKPAVGHEVAFAPDGKTVAVYCNENDFVVLWDRATRKEVKRLTSYHSRSRNPGWFGFSSDGKLLASLRSGKITLWDVGNGEQVQERASHAAEMDCLAVSPDGKYLASAAGGDQTVRLWNAHSGKSLHVWPMRRPRIVQLFFTPDSRNLIAGSSRGETILWDVRDGERRRIFPLPGVAKDGFETTTAFTLSPDGKRLVALSLLGESKEGAYKFQRYRTTWDVGSGERTERRALSFAPNILLLPESLSLDGRFATSYELSRLLVYDVAADRCVRAWTGNVLAPVAFSPDGKLLAFAGNSSPLANGERVRVHDFASDAEALSLAAGRTWERVFSPDGRYLLTAGEDDLRLWELASGKEVLRRYVATPTTAPENVSSVNSLAFAADGRSVAAGMHDTNVLIWNLAPATRRKPQRSAADLDKRWRELGGDATLAYKAAGTLLADPENALPLLRERLQPVKEDAPRIRRLIADLGSERFAVRDAASKELEKMDDAAHAVLRQALKDAASLEMRRRIQALLSVPWIVQSPEKLRQIRAVAVLEQIGNAESRRLLQRLTEGAKQARQTREAKAALQRLKQ